MNGQRPSYAHLSRTISRRSLLQWSLMGLATQTPVPEEPRFVDPGTEIARVSLMKHFEVDVDALGDTFWHVFSPMDETAPKREPYPIMWLVSVALLFDSASTVNDTLLGSFDAYPSWLADYYDAMEVREGREFGVHRQDISDTFGTSYWTWHVIDKEEIFGVPDFFIAGVVAQARDALVFNWAGSYRVPPVLELRYIVNSSISHWSYRADTLVPDFYDFIDPMGIRSNGSITEYLVDTVD